MNIIRTTEAGAFVYHDGHVIRGINFVADPELEKYEKITISTDDAVRFIAGDLNCADWFIWRYENETVLHSAVTTLTLDFIDEGYVRLAPAMPSPVWLSIKRYRAAQRIVFQLCPDLNFQCPVEHLVFSLTEKNDPSVVLQVIRLSIRELVQERMIVLWCPVQGSFDIYTRRIFDDYRVSEALPGEDLVLLYPQGHFINLMRFVKGPVECGLQAVLNRSERRLTLSVIGDGVEVYGVPVGRLRLIFSMPGDPSLILHTASVQIEDLRGGTSIQLPKNLDRSFDLWSPLVYRHAGIIEVNYG